MDTTSESVEEIPPRISEYIKEQKKCSTGTWTSIWLHFQASSLAECALKQSFPYGHYAFGLHIWSHLPHCTIYTLVHLMNAEDKWIGQKLKTAQNVKSWDIVKKTNDSVVGSFQCLMKLCGLYFIQVLLLSAWRYQHKVKFQWNLKLFWKHQVRISTSGSWAITILYKDIYYSPTSVLFYHIVLDHYLFSHSSSNNNKL